MTLESKSGRLDLPPQNGIAGGAVLHGVPLLARPAVFLPAAFITPTLLDKQAVAPGATRKKAASRRLSARLLKFRWKPGLPLNVRTGLGTNSLPAQFRQVDRFPFHLGELGLLR